ncbi:MAG: hypothetical protein ABEI57_07795 [Halapricum sp.]
MTAETVSRWARTFVAASACWLVLALAALTLDLPRRAVVVLLLFGFVLHTVFGKAYSLVPTYFDRQLAFPYAPAIQFPFTLLGVAGLALSGTRFVDIRVVAQIGAAAWAVGVAVFLGAIGWTIRDNLTGAETATGDANADRRPIDRLANVFVPVALVYLALGTYATLAGVTPLPVLIDGYPPRASHLLAAGTGALLVFAIGFRLLPRFLVASPPRRLVPVVLLTGAFGPLLIALGLPAGSLLHAGAGLEAIAVLTFAAAYLVLFVRSSRARIGFYAVLAGALFGVLGVALGLWMAFGTLDPAVVTAHFRVNLLGFLGLTILGVSYQFYPPAVGTFPGAGDRTAAGVIVAISVGLLLQVGGLLGSVDAVVTAGAVLALLGGLAHTGLLLGLFVERYGGR